MELDIEPEGPTSQDWYDDTNLLPTQAQNINDLDDLRRHNPILWALVLGLTTSRSIAGRICRPHYHVIDELRHYKSLGWVYDSEARVSVEWRFADVDDEMVKELIRLRLWILSERKLGGIFNPREEREQE